MDRIKLLLNELIGLDLTKVVGDVYYWVVAPLLAQSTVHWIFFLSSILVAWVFFLAYVASRGVSTTRGFLGYLFPKAVWGHPSAVLDYKYYVVTQFVLAYLRIGQFVLGVFAILYVAEGVKSLLDATFGPSPSDARPGWLAVIAFTVLTTVAFDFSRFVDHYLHHRVPILWEFHKVHHSAEVLTPMSSFRAHPVDQMVELFLRMVSTACVSGVFAHFYPVGIQELTILSHGAIMFFFHLTSHLRHSHVPVSYGPLSRYFVSPVMHQLHHSTAREHFDKNFGFIFSFWDRLIGTQYVPRREERWELGLPPGSGKYDSVWNLYFHPFAAAARLLKTPRAAFKLSGS